MKRSLLSLMIGLLLGGLLPADDKRPVADATKEEMKKLEGAWKVDSLETTKGKATAKNLPIDQIVFQRDRVEGDESHPVLEVTGPSATVRCRAALPPRSSHSPFANSSFDV